MTIGLPRSLFYAADSNTSFSPSLRSALLFGIGERRGRDHVDGVGELETGDEAFTDAGIHRTVRGVGLVRKAGEVLLQEGLLEVLARVPGHDFMAQLRRKLLEPFSEHIEPDTRIEQRYFGAHVRRDAGGGVQGNGFPDRLYLFFGDAMGDEKLPGGVGAIDFEAFVGTRELLEETEIVKGGGDIEEFRVEAALLLPALLGRKQVDAEGVIEEQIGGILPQQGGGLFREQRIGEDEGG
jgi:hypothetical protein